MVKLIMPPKTGKPIVVLRKKRNEKKWFIVALDKLPYPQKEMLLETHTNKRKAKSALKVYKRTFPLIAKIMLKWEN